MAVAILVTALVVAPALASREVSPPEGPGLVAAPKHTKKPHPHATPDTAQPTAQPTPPTLVTAAPAATARAATAEPNAATEDPPHTTRAQTKATGRPRGGADPTKRPRKGASTPAPTPSEPAPIVLSTTPTPIEGASTGTGGPGPEILAFGVSLVGLLGLGGLRLLAARRRHEADLQPDRLAATAAAAHPAGHLEWKNLSLDDDEQLPRWLRASNRNRDGRTPGREESVANAAPEERAATSGLLQRVGANEDSQAWDAAGALDASHGPVAWGDPVAPGAPVAPAPLSEPVVPVASAAWSEPAATPRAPMTFAEPVGPSAMRLVVTDPQCELYDQPEAGQASVLAELASGDEVEVVDLVEPWVRVQTPQGHAGWIRSASLGV